MNFLEATGLLSAGAILALGGSFLLRMTDHAPVPVVVAQPAAFLAPVAQPTAPAPQVTRAAKPIVPIAAADQLHAIIAEADEGLSSREPLTEEQQQVISFFEKIARDRNAEGGSDNNRINFDNLTIDQLDVRYYYTAAAKYDDIDVPTLLDEQTQLVQANICGQDSIRTLITDYGLGFYYTFISKDYRFIGQVQGDVSRCAG